MLTVKPQHPSRPKACWSSPRCTSLTLVSTLCEAQPEAFKPFIFTMLLMVYGYLLIMDIVTSTALKNTLYPFKKSRPQGGSEVSTS